MNMPSSHVCVLNESGRIIAVNDAWRRFAEANQGGERCCEGANYLAVCYGAVGVEAAEANEFAIGIRSVLWGINNCERYLMEYSCDSPRVQRRFVGTVRRLMIGDRFLAIVEHTDITERKADEGAIT